MKLYTFSFTEPLDLTNQTNLQAISRVEGFLYIETGEIWIEQDWWDKYKINKPITVTYKNPNLTTFAPTVKKEQEKENHPTVSSTKNPEVLEAKSGEAKFKLTDGTKVKILPNVKIETENNIVTNKNSRTFKARSSHKNLSYFAKINGKKQTLSAKNFNQKTGEFTIEVEGFEKGNNYIEFYFTQDKENPVLIKGINLKYDPNFIANLNAWQQLALLAVVLMSFVMLRKILLSKLPANPK